MDSQENAVLSKNCRYSAPATTFFTQIGDKMTYFNLLKLLYLNNPLKVVLKIFNDQSHEHISKN